MIKQGLIEAGFDVLRGYGGGARFAGELHAALYQQALHQLAHAEGKIARLATHHDGINNRCRHRSSSVK
jgi:hypothetical protein